jgi:hypothetical protein
MVALRNKAIRDFHHLLTTDEALSPVVFEKLRSAMRRNRLVYGERPIGIALRPHFLHEKQFRALTRAVERVLPSAVAAASTASLM